VIGASCPRRDDAERSPTRHLPSAFRRAWPGLAGGHQIGGEALQVVEHEHGEPPFDASRRAGRCHQCVRYSTDAALNRCGTQQPGDHDFTADRRPRGTDPDWMPAFAGMTGEIAAFVIPAHAGIQ